jgi:hypothetical protein
MNVKQLLKSHVGDHAIFRNLISPIYKVVKKNVYMIPWKTNFSRVELEITSFCSLACLNCDRSVRQAPTREYMSLEQIEKFVTESLDLKWNWERILILGGEPTLHPQFFEAMGIIKKYKDAYPECIVEIATNGYGPKVNRILAQMPEWILIRNTTKESNDQHFSSYNMAPMDNVKYRQADFSKGCWITEQCGIGLTPHGFYPCGAGASVDRVFGFDIGIKQLSNLNRKSMKEKLKMLCGYCGHYKENYRRETISEEQISLTWEKGLKTYKRKRPFLSLYVLLYSLGASIDILEDLLLIGLDLGLDIFMDFACVGMPI